MDGPQGSSADWSWACLGTGIGLSGLHVSRAGGRTEIVAACGGEQFGGNRTWVILAYDAARNTYEQVFAPEVALSNGAVLDAATGAVEWRAPAPFGRDMLAAYVDGDGLDELVASEGWSWIRAYDIDQRSVQWSLPIRQVDAIEIGDIDGDGALELLVGEGQWGSVRCFDVAIRQEEWAVANPLHGVTGVAQGDLDGDGRLAMVTVSASSRSGFGPPHAVIFDVATATRLATAPVGLVGASAVDDLRLHDLDGDGDLEILVASDEVTAADFDLAAGVSTLWSFSPRATAGPIASMDIADLEGDGRAELVVADGAGLGVWDLAARTPSWTVVLPAPIGAVRCVDFDGDGGFEIAALADRGVLHVVDGVTRMVEASLTVPASSGAVHAHLRTAGLSSAIVVADSGGGLTLVSLQGSRYRALGTLWLNTNGGGAVQGLATVPRSPWFVATADTVLYVHEGPWWVWRSDYRDYGFGTHVEFHPTQPMVLAAAATGVLGFRPVL